ncbi:cytochrome P450 71D9 [Jatropha curcas]|uniref:cytochrome P450 71D9 n=1 Tax=Jatropha curcas TaxID=180498 RepID=UPI001892DFDD|nr:cytochrome P450 71D9 [Jatropha curcas]
MEHLLQSSIFPALFTFLLFNFILKRKLKTSSRKLAPGPWKLPIIGNMHQLLGSLLHHRLRHLSNKYRTVMHLKLGQVSQIVISSPEAAKKVMKTHDIIFAQRPYLLAADIILYNFKDIAFAPYGEGWRQMRKICTLQLLSTKRVRSFRVVREEETSKFIRSIYGLPKVNISKMVFSLSNAITLKSAFGKVSERHDAFLPLVQKSVLVFGGFSVADIFPSVKFLNRITGMRSKLEKLHQEADIMLENIINEHKENKRLRK